MCVQVNDIGLSMTCPALRERKWNKQEKEKKPDESTYCTHGWASAFLQVSRMKFETKFLIDPYTANTRLRACHAQSRAAADEEGSESTTIQLLSLIVFFLEPIKVTHIVCSCCCCFSSLFFYLLRVLGWDGTAILHNCNNDHIKTMTGLCCCWEIPI